MGRYGHRPRPREQAQVQVSDLDDGVREIRVECSRSATMLRWTPAAGLEISEPMLISSAAFEHSERCGCCDLEAVFAQGNEELRAVVELVSAVLQADARRN